MGTALVARDLKKSFPVGRGRSTQVLNGVDLHVDQGEMVAIVGRSGSGKSTLLYCLSGLERPDSGSVEIMGEQLVGARHTELASIRRRHTGFIFQSYNLIPALNAADNVALPARLSGHSMSRDAARRALACVGLSGRERQRPADMSGGEQQRIAVARAVASDADIVFADEPTGALDSRNRRDVLNMLRTIGEDPRRAVVLVTHDLEAAALAHRVLVLKDGAIAAELDTPTPSLILRTLEEPC